MEEPWKQEEFRWKRVIVEARRPIVKRAAATRTLDCRTVTWAPLLARPAVRSARLGMFHCWASQQWHPISSHALTTIVGWRFNGPPRFSRGSRNVCKRLILALGSATFMARWPALST